MESSKQIGITEVVVRDGIQSLLATRVPLRDLVSILPVLDKVGYWSLETWGGATYDSCIRFLNEKRELEKGKNYWKWMVKVNFHH